jgi:hypothetical protein
VSTLIVPPIACARRSGSGRPANRQDRSLTDSAQLRVQVNRSTPRVSITQPASVPGLVSHNCRVGRAPKAAPGVGGAEDSQNLGSDDGVGLPGLRMAPWRVSGAAANMRPSLVVRSWERTWMRSYVVWEWTEGDSLERLSCDQPCRRRRRPSTRASSRPSRPSRAAAVVRSACSCTRTVSPTRSAFNWSPNGRLPALGRHLTRTKKHLVHGGRGQHSGSPFRCKRGIGGNGRGVPTTSSSPWVPAPASPARSPGSAGSDAVVARPIVVGSERRNHEATCSVQVTVAVVLADPSKRRESVDHHRDREVLQCRKGLRLHLA